MTPPLTHPSVDSFPNFGTNLTHQRLTSDFDRLKSRQNHFLVVFFATPYLVLNHASVSGEIKI